MKCPLCEAPTEIKETRQRDGEFIRRRECYNYHTFQTKEVPITEPKPKRQRIKAPEPR